MCLSDIVAQEESNSLLKHLNLEVNNVAISGYDLISYFDNNPQKGKQSINAKFNNRIYYFINENNRNKFIKSPSKYLPKYGGWCAYAMGNTSEKVEIDPKTYKIVGDKLYLFYNKYFTNTLNSWNEDQEILKQKADINWSKIIKNK